MSLPFIGLSGSGYTDLGAGCPGPLAGLIPGALYLVSGLAQSSAFGGIASFSVVAMATAPDTLSDEVHIILPDDTSWSGSIDWSDCQLYAVFDNRNNRVEEKISISEFPFGAANVEYNYVYSGGNVRITNGAAAVTAFRRNVVSGLGGTVLLDDSAFITVIDNTLLDGSIVISLAPTAALTVRDNLIAGRSIINLNPGLGIASSGGTIANNTIVSNSQLVTINGPVNIIYNNISGNSTVTLEAVRFAANIITFNGNTVQNQSVVNIDSTVTQVANGAFTFVNCIFSGTTLTVSGTKRIFSFTRCSFYNSTLNWTVANHNNTFTEVTVSDNVSLTVSNTVAAILVLNSLLSGTFSYTDGLGSVSSSIEALQMNRNTNFIVEVNGAAFTLVDVVLGQFGEINTGGSVTGAAIQRGYVEVGTFNFAGFDASNFRLQDANSTLIAPISDAIKDGYVNALP